MKVVDEQGSDQVKIFCIRRALLKVPFKAQIDKECVKLALMTKRWRQLSLKLNEYGQEERLEP